MPTQNINAAVSADAQAVKDAFAAVLNKLPFFINMTPDERKAIVKTGLESVSFIKNALTAAQDHPTILPSSFDTTAFQKDVVLFEVLVQLATLAASLAGRTLAGIAGPAVLNRFSPALPKHASNGRKACA